LAPYLVGYWRTCKRDALNFIDIEQEKKITQLDFEQIYIELQKDQ